MTERATESKRARIVANDAGFSVRSVERDERGRAHHCFRVETSAKTLYVKLSGSPRPRFATEIAALTALRDRSILAPTLVAHGDDFIVTASLGDDLRPIGHNDIRAWSEFGAWLAELHAIDPSGLGLRYDTDPLPLGERLAKSLRTSIEHLPDRYAERARKTAELLLDERYWKTGFTHRDLRADNVLVRSNGELAGVVDFEHSAGAATAWDLVKALDWNSPSAAARAAFARTYGDLPDHEIFRDFEALMLLSRPTQRLRYGAWAEQALDSAR